MSNPALDTEALALGKKISGWVARNGIKSGLIGAAVVGGISIMDMLVRADNQARSNEYVAKQRRQLNREIKQRNNSKIIKEAYNFQVKYMPKEEEMVLPSYEGLPQELFMRRTGHTNSWGGRRY